MSQLELRRLEPDHARPAFVCGDKDLDEFYAVDSIEMARELISVTYVLCDEGESAIGFFSIANDAIKKEQTPGSAFKRMVKLIPHKKRFSSIPAVKIGRLGVSSAAHGNGYGTMLLDFLKVWFTEGNKTGCRFLIVDAYNTESATMFYQKNGFKFLTGNDEKDDTRIMYFDLITFRPSE